MIQIGPPTQPRPTPTAHYIEANPQPNDGPRPPYSRARATTLFFGNEGGARTTLGGGSKLVFRENAGAAAIAKIRPVFV